MRTLKVLAAAAVLSTAAATANAGGLAPVIPEAPVVIVLSFFLASNLTGSA